MNDLDAKMNHCIEQEQWDELGLLMAQRIQYLQQQIDFRPPCESKKEFIEQLLVQEYGYLKQVADKKEAVRQKLQAIQNGKKAKKLYGQ
tara:strand:- start:1171 stop:1437 length:267 start_codon:yes stop_codon:yes gene_type:complete